MRLRVAAATSASLTLHCFRVSLKKKRLSFVEGEKAVLPDCLRQAGILGIACLPQAGSRAISARLIASKALPKYRLFITGRASGVPRAMRRSQWNLMGAMKHQRFETVLLGENANLRDQGSETSFAPLWLYQKMV